MRLQSRDRRSTPLGVSLLLLFLAPGCEEPRHVNTKLNAPSAPAPAPATEPASASEVVQPREILGQRTTDIRNADDELKKGAQVATTKITAKDPITLPGNAYVTIIGRTSILQIEHAMNLYKATNDRFPKDFAEFNTEIIKANNLALPKLPYYQEYGYDEKEHKLIVLEYPDRKEALQKQDDAKYGR
ncbi:hypothetical protein [Singulisphaera acidiphila]|uniref:Uncharacterized protein n=1 Tax=Singulisphaera acidiphila (strain ATCC BAA-1392 / DSM 18658 / VKM B-2454 / MOB10) TaxID=886293 RepID=L0D6I4_SINAD|nr:hypothetical protein [Singulisphaera acidiphila]AGA24475.1 hypothetical protein Sinac_0011 [Singulisphaera acidiphila DSM 18658]